jgi:hypothetical protein
LREHVKAHGIGRGEEIGQPDIFEQGLHVQRVVLSATISAQQAGEGDAPVEGLERAGIHTGLGGIQVRKQLKFAALY